MPGAGSAALSAAGRESDQRARARTHLEGLSACAFFVEHAEDLAGGARQSQRAEHRLARHEARSRGGSRRALPQGRSLGLRSRALRPRRPASPLLLCGAGRRAAADGGARTCMRRFVSFCICSSCDFIVSNIAAARRVAVRAGGLQPAPGAAVGPALRRAWRVSGRRGVGDGAQGRAHSWP